LKIVSIRDGFEQAFWNHVNRDPFDYHFFILDWRENREKTEILLATEGEKIEGAMLVYSDYIVQLRGNVEIVERLFEYVNLERIELEAPLNCEQIITKKYKPQIKHELVLMWLKRGDENIQIKHKPVQLGIEDAADVAKVMRSADPEWWGDVTAEEQSSKWEKVFWLGIRHGRNLVSVGNTRFKDFGSNIGVIATDERYRNMGYATSIVSALVQEIQKRSSTPLIHVIGNNAPAIRVYSRVGFKPYQHYVLMRAQRIKN